MPKLPRTSAKNIMRALEKLGFSAVRKKGSHVIFRKDDRGCVVPEHRIVAVGTLRSILRQAQITPEEFLAAMGK